MALYNNWWWWMLSPWTLPSHGLGDSWERQIAFPAAPYIDGIDGYVRIAGLTPPAPGGNGSLTGQPGQAGRRVLGNGSAVRLHLEGGAADLSLQRGAVGLLWSGAHRFEISGELRGYLERNGDGSRDRLWIGSAAVSVLFAQSEYAQFRTGLGTRWMPDGDVSHSGWHFLYGMDFYPMQPLVLSLQGDAGTLGGAWVTSARGSVGAVVDQVEFYLGYEGFWVEDVDLSTWLVGVRLWQ